MTHLRKTSVSPHQFAGPANTGFKSDFGNLPFSSAIKANGYPAHIQHQQLQNLSTSAEYSMLPLHSNEHEAVLGKAYLSFRDATLQMIADGMNARQVLGSPDYVNLDLFFRERLPTGWTFSRYFRVRDPEESCKSRYIRKIGQFGFARAVDEGKELSHFFVVLRC
jgi:hypothetical protein